MYFFNLIAISIPIILFTITFLYYWPLVMEYFDKQRSINYKNSNNHRFLILLILITLSICLSFLIICNNSVILSWIGQFIVLIVFYSSIDLKLSAICRYLNGKNIEYEISRSNNVLLEEIYINSSQINESLSEEIKLSTSDIIKSSERSNESIIESLNTHSNDVKDVLSDRVNKPSTELINDISEMSEKIVFSNIEIKKSIDELHTVIDKSYFTDSINFIRSTSEDDFKALINSTQIVLKKKNYDMFRDLVLKKVKPISKIDLEVPYRSKYTKNNLKKEELFTFLNLFFDLENISNKVFKNEYNISKQNFFNKYFLLNGVGNKFKRVDFNGRYN